VGEQTISAFSDDPGVAAGTLTMQILSRAEASVPTLGNLPLVLLALLIGSIGVLLVARGAAAV